ncbi:MULTISPECIES: RimK family alpha-L-glutamate ligase [unclassified Virgibacillus]|uniref:ATP-grasp domain-containing protein n=1 Tax=unclassified Virgibacillus TaxID=2620237 RepID=UPI0024DE46B6|nr:RimK family alpha-L-glutamate ligase [Virgibacillus sp. LDC-1]
MKPTGWIIYNGNLRGNKFKDYAEMLQQAAEKKGSLAYIIKNNDLSVFLDGKESKLLQKAALEKPDYVIFTDKDIYLAKQLELLGIRVFNRAQTIAMSDDKIATYQALASKNLPIPKTIIAPKAFLQHDAKAFFKLDTIVQQLGFPMVVKEAFGSFGEQVYLIESMRALEQITEQLQTIPFVFQEFISTSYGKDIRLQVVGNRVVAAMKRIAKDDFRANITAGGVMEPYTPSEKEKQLAIASSQAIGADFAGVDLLFGKEDASYICEINSNAHIRNLLDCTGVNVADKIMEYIFETISH